MDMESVRLEALKIAIAHEKMYNPDGAIATARKFESYITEKQVVKKKPGRPKKND